MLLQNSLLHSQSWRKLYTAALLETERSRTSVLIAQAENAIVARARELFKSGDENFAEKQALDSALRTLKLLQMCVGKAPHADRQKTYTATLTA